VGHDEELIPVEEFVCHLYGTPEQPTTNHARLHLFGKIKKGLEILHPIRDALELRDGDDDDDDWCFTATFVHMIGYMGRETSKGKKLSQR